MRKIFISTLVILGSILVNAASAQEIERDQILQITSLPSNIDVYVTPWYNWQQIRQEAISTEADVLKPGERAELLTRQEDLYVFVWLNWVYWNIIAEKDSQYLIYERLLRKENIYRSKLDKVTLQDSTYALLLVLGLFEKDVHYKLEQSTGRRFFDYKHSMSLLPVSALEYGIAVKSFDPTVWQFMALYKVQGIEINSFLEGITKKIE